MKSDYYLEAVFQIVPNPHDNFGCEHFCLEMLNITRVRAQVLALVLVQAIITTVVMSFV